MTDSPIDIIAAFLTGWDAEPYLAGETVVCGGMGGGPHLLVETLRGAVDERGQLAARADGLAASISELEAERLRLTARVAELEQFQTARKADDRHIDRTLAMLLLREGGRAEFTAAEMVSAPAHGEFVCCENLLTSGMVLAFQASDVDMSKAGDEQMETVADDDE